MCTVESTFKHRHLAPAAEGAGGADGIHAGLRTAVAEDDFLGAWHGIGYQTCQWLLVRVVPAPLDTPINRLLYRLGNYLGGMAQNMGAPSHGQIDVFVAVDINDLGTLRLAYVDGVAHDDRVNHFLCQNPSTLAQLLCRTGSSSLKLLIYSSHNRPP